MGTGDVVSVYQGASVSSGHSILLSGNLSTSSSVYSIDEHLSVKIVKNSNTTGNLSISYSTSPTVNCVSTLPQAGTIKGIPNCGYLLSPTDPKSNIMISFSNITLSSLSEAIFIYDGNSTESSILEVIVASCDCNINVTSSQGNHMLVVFIGQTGGWFAKWNTANCDTCGQSESMVSTNTVVIIIAVLSSVLILGFTFGVILYIRAILKRRRIPKLVFSDEFELPANYKSRSTGTQNNHPVVSLDNKHDEFEDESLD